MRNSTQHGAQSKMKDVGLVLMAWPSQGIDKKLPDPCLLQLLEGLESCNTIRVRDVQSNTALDVKRHSVQ